MEFVIATHNRHKVEEFTRILAPLGIEIVTAELTEAEETGTTFMENAYIKAASACKETGRPAIADDSGLMVNALNGEPGVNTARYAEPGQRKKKVLRLLENTPDDQRTAQFVSAICCVFPDGRVLEAEGVCPGTITHACRGEAGFGYDPIFAVGEKTFAEMTAKEKDDVSHRGIALRKFKDVLQKALEEN